MSLRMKERIIEDGGKIVEDGGERRRKRFGRVGGTIDVISGVIGGKI